MSDTLKALERIVDYISDIESDIYGQPAYNIDLDIETIRAAITEQAETGVMSKDVVEESSCRCTECMPVEIYGERSRYWGPCMKGFHTTPTRTEGVTIPRDEFFDVSDLISRARDMLDKKMPNVANSHLSRALSILEHRG